MPFYPLPRGLRAVFFCNIASATLWFCCLGRFLVLLPLVGRRFLPVAIADFFHVVSVCPLIQFFVVNIIGRSEYSGLDFWGLLNVIRMVWICYGVVYPYPKIAKHASYSTLILSWCVLNLIDSSYYAFKVKTKSSPKWLFKSHYSHFYVTAPMAMVSEMTLIFLSGTYEKHRLCEVFLDACLLLYIPVGYYAFKYLISRKRDKYHKYLEKRRTGRMQGIEMRPTSSPTPATTAASVAASCPSGVSSADGSVSRTSRHSSPPS